VTKTAGLAGLSLIAASVLVSDASATTIAPVRMTSGELSLVAPENAALRASGPDAWVVRAHGFTMGIVRGVADLDDSEPRRCYDAEQVEIDGRGALLRKTRASARADCPENYVSVYLPALRDGTKAVFVWGQGAYDIDMPVMADIAQSIQFAHAAAR